MGCILGGSMASSCFPEDDISMQAATQDCWMPAAMSVPGMLHILDNASHDMDTQHLQHFEAWYADLKNLAAFLCFSDHRRRFVVTCLRRSLVHSEAAENCFAKSPPQLHEKRWGHVINFLKSARQQMHLCRVVWDQKAFASEGGRESKAFVIDQLSKTLANPQFFAYYDMVIELHGVLEAMQKYVEGCPCHPPRPHGWPKLSQTPCPMNTLRAPELAAGALPRLIEQKTAEGLANLLKESCVSLPLEQWGHIADDFQRGVAAISAIIHTKCSFWLQLPWHACGMLHWDEGLARRCGASCMQAWDALEASQKAKQLPFLRALLSEHEHRCALERWIAGELARVQLPREVLEILAPLTFVPVAERIIEAQHSIIKKKVGFTRAGPVACSLALRSGMFLEDTLRKRPHELESLIECFEEARQLQQFALNRGQ